VDVWLDRAMSPFPALYSLAVVGVANAALTQTSDPNEVLTFFGLQRGAVPNIASLALPSRDIANPSFDAARRAAGPNATMGTFAVDGTGDYATDEGLLSLKKRIFRRLTTRKGAFAHEPTYGTLFIDSVKRLASATLRVQLASDAEAQISQEPEVERCRVTLVADDASKGLFRYSILVKTRAGAAVRFDTPVPISQNL